MEALCRGGSSTGPVVVVGDDSARTEVVVADDEARAAGVRAGMPFTTACALVPAIRALGYSVLMGVAPTPLAAWLLARAGGLPEPGYAGA